MIKEFIEAWEKRKNEIREKLSAEHPENYLELVLMVVELLDDPHATYPTPSTKRLYEIDDSKSLDGTLVYVIGENGGIPSNYWYVKIFYGSCAATDSLQFIRQYSDDPPTEQQVTDYMTLALHIIQHIKQMDGETV